MYRSDDEAYRARYESTRRNAERAWQEVQHEIDLVQALRQQLMERSLGAPDAPDVAPPPTFPDIDDTTSPLDLARLADVAEKEGDRLRADCEWVQRLAHLLNQRLMGVEVSLPLGPPPRRVPWSYLVAEVVTWWSLAIPAFGAVFAFAAALESPRLSQTIAVSALAVSAVAIVRGYRRRRFLARCREAVATRVVHSETTSTKMTNWPTLVSHGWDVSMSLFSGRGTRDVVEFVTHGGRTGELIVTGRGYESGVVLYDPITLRAADVKQLRCRPRPDANGNWAGRIALRYWLTGILFVAVASAVVGVMVMSIGATTS